MRLDMLPKFVNDSLKSNYHFIIADFTHDAEIFIQDVRENRKKMHLCTVDFYQVA